MTQEPLSPQDEFAQAPAVLADRQALARDPSPHTIYVHGEADPHEIADFVQAATGRMIDFPCLHYRLFSSDTRRAGVVVLHNVSPTAEAELVAWATPGIWQRSALRFLARWIFETCQVRRLVVRIHGHDERSKDYARRLGFRFEGTLRRYFADDADASLWAMLPRDCPWLR